MCKRSKFLLCVLSRFTVLPALPTLHEIPQAIAYWAYTPRNNTPIVIVHVRSSTLFS